MREYAPCLLPWNCVVGVMVFVWVGTFALGRVGDEYSCVDTLGLLCLVLGARQVVRLARGLRGARRASAVLLAAGYLLFAFVELAGRLVPWRVSDAAGWWMLAGPVALMVVGAAVGYHTGGGSCARAQRGTAAVKKAEVDNGRSAY